MMTRIFKAAGVLAVLLSSSVAFAAEGGATEWTALGAALAIGIAALGGAIGQGLAGAAALEGMARNPQANLLVPMIIVLALIESLVIYGLVVAFTIIG